jgi:hypothetical protein
MTLPLVLDTYWLGHVPAERAFNWHFVMLRALRALAAQPQQPLLVRLEGLPLGEQRCTVRVTFSVEPES